MATVESCVRQENLGQCRRTATTFGDNPIPKDPDDMFKLHLQRILSSIRTDLQGAHYHHHRAGCEIVGDTAIALTLVKEIWHAFDVSDVEKDLPTLCTKPGYKTTLQDGRYFITVGDTTAEVVAMASMTAQVQIVSPEQRHAHAECEGFYIEMDRDTWHQYVNSKSELMQIQALAKTKVNGTLPAVLCTCCYAGHPKCPFHRGPNRRVDEDYPIVSCSAAFTRQTKIPRSGLAIGAIDWDDPTNPATYTLNGW